MSALLVCYDGCFHEHTTRRVFVAELRASGFARSAAGRRLLRELAAIVGPACVVLKGKDHTIVPLANA